MGEGQRWFEPPAPDQSLLLLQFMLCYGFLAVPALNFRAAPWYEQMYAKAWLKLLDSFSVGENFNPDLKRGRQSWQAGILN